MVEPGIRIFLQTRGRARAADYAFLGGAPTEPWWRAYRDATAFDHPTVLVSSDGDRWAAYLSGIPSARVDAVGTVVRYTLVLDGPCGAADAACVPAAVAIWLRDVATGSGRLAAALDARFPLGDVERWLAGSVDEPVTRRVLAAFATLPPAPPATDEPGDWIGAVAAPGPRAAFTARVAALVDGAPGRALLLNLVGTATDADPLLEATSPVAVLVESTDPRLARCTALRPVVEAKKAPAPPARAGAVALAGMAVLPLVALVGALALTALVATLLIWLL